MFVQFSVASFQRDPKTKQPNVEFEFQVLDDKGQPTLGQAAEAHPGQRGVDEKERRRSRMRFPLFMSRPGQVHRADHRDRQGRQQEGHLRAAGHRRCRPN